LYHHISTKIQDLFISLKISYDAKRHSETMNVSATVNKPIRRRR